MPYLTPLSLSNESAQRDRVAKERYSISSEILMESAGALSAREISSHPSWIASTVMIFCGPGHNGGDGLALARHLYSDGVRVAVFCSGKTSSPLIEKQKKRLSSQGISLYPLEQEKIQKTAGKASLIVDALFGVGLSRNIEGNYLKLIQWINAASQPVVSLDIPSGLNGDTGRVKGEAVQADLSLSFGLKKPGFYLMEGPAHVGRVINFSIGFPPALLSQESHTRFLIDKDWVSSQLPKRSPTDHKARQGHLLVLAGSPGFWGAGRLSAEAAYRMGVGYVTWAGGEHPPLESCSDVLTKKISEPHLFAKKTAVAIGPGLGTEENTKKLLLTLKETGLPAVVDADAWTVCVKENLFPLPENWISTPHSGELGGFFKLKGEKIDEDRCSYALKAGCQAGSPVLLKGFHSVLAWKGKCGIIDSGNAALSKAGTGDVLTGFIGALLARSLSPFHAAAVGSFIHGLIADRWIQSGKDADTLTAKDLKDLLPSALKQLRK